MKVTYHGHAVVSIVMTDGAKLLFDPFITGNEKCDLDSNAVAPDYIFVTHAHNDHLGDTLDIALRTGATVITTVEIADYLDTKGVKTHGMQPGGGFDFEFGRVKLTPAIHGSALWMDSDAEKPITLGLASGILVTVDNQTIYHLGDTALYSDMQLIGELNNIDLAFVPIGDNYTMGPDDAVIATRWLKAKKAVPIHYNTFPEIKQNPNDYINQLDENVGILLEIGQSVDL